MKPRFHVKDTFEITERNLFVMAGSIVEGEIEAGMFVCVPFNAALGLSVPIQSIEIASRQGGEEVCLCFGLPTCPVEILRDLNLGDEILEVTQDGFE